MSIKKREAYLLARTFQSERVIKFFFSFSNERFDIWAYYILKYTNHATYVCGLENHCIAKRFFMDVYIKNIFEPIRHRRDYRLMT